MFYDTAMADLDETTFTISPAPSTQLPAEHPQDTRTPFLSLIDLHPEPLSSHDSPLHPHTTLDRRSINVSRLQLATRRPTAACSSELSCMNCKAMTPNIPPGLSHPTRSSPTSPAKCCTQRPHSSEPSDPSSPTRPLPPRPRWLARSELLNIYIYRTVY